MAISASVVLKSGTFMGCLLLKGATRLRHINESRLCACQARFPVTAKRGW
jgi:hypothetical protein